MSSEGAVLAARAASRPDDVVLSVEGAGALTWRDWEERSNAVARGLAARGVGPGERVGVLFDARQWADFAVARLAVLKTGAAPVLLSPGSPPPHLARALCHSEASGLLCAPHLVPPGCSAWAAHPDDVGRGRDTGAVPARDMGAVPARDMGAVPGRDMGAVPARDMGPVPVELIHPPAPMAPPRSWAPAPGDFVAGAGPPVDGWLVHAWAPGTLAGQQVVRLLLGGGGTRAASPGRFAPDRLCALVARHRAVACGLTPALAAALLASGAWRDHDLTSVTRLLLSGVPSPDLGAGLRAAFPAAALSEIDPYAGLVPTPAAASAEQAPVALSQEGMLWHEQFTPASFNLPCLVRRYEGRLDMASLEWALSELVRRHQPLRSTFELEGGEPRQTVAPHDRVALATADLGHLSPSAREAEVARTLADATGRPFDLATGPLFEPRLLRLGPDDHLLVVRLHHTVFDDWSVDVFRRELSALYTAALSGAPSPLVEPSTTFAGFCRRQRARVAGELGDAQRSWWREELAGAPLAVQVPIGGGGPGGRSSPGEPLRLDLPPSLAAGLRRLAPTLRATPFMTVLAAFSVVLSRATGQDDLLIATVVAHRGRSELEPLIGCFTKKIPLRLRLHGDPTFPDLVARTRSSLLGALSHQDVAFDAVVQDALGRPAATHGVVPQVAMVFQGETPQQAKLSLPGLRTGPYEVRGEARRERHFSSGPDEAGDGGTGPPTWGDGIYEGTFLILSLLETPDGMALVARGVFDRPAGRRLLEGFRELLADVVGDPSRPISALRPDVPAPGPARSVPTDDVLEVRGFRARRSRLEAALAACPGVADVALAVEDGAAGEPRLVARVVAGGDLPPTLVQLRHALWSALPGALWPAEIVVVDPPARPRPDPVGGDDGVAALLTAIWGEVRGARVEPTSIYWQDFSFLHALVEARQAGIPVTDELVVRCRTPEMLAAALHAAGSDATEPLP